MSDYKLKHYNKHLKKIKDFLKISSLKLKYSDSIDCDGAFSMKRRTIYIDSQLSESEEISVLLHEIGHYLDSVINSSSSDNGINLAYERFYQGKADNKQKKIVLKSEGLAWNLGRNLASILGIKLGKWYDLDVVEHMDYYRDSIDK